MRRYADDTSVSVEKSRAEIEKILRRYGAKGFISGWDEDRAFIGFAMHDRQVKFILTLPNRTEERFLKDGRSSHKKLSIDRQHEKWEQACRQSWRALALVIKAKLEAVAAEITVFEDEFLAHIVLPNGETVGQHVRPAIADAYANKRVQPLLPDYST